MTQAVLAYFSRLAGRELTRGSQISLTSAQAGAALSWMRRSGVDFSESRLLSKLFTVGQLLDKPAAEEPDRGPPSEAPRLRAGNDGAFAGVGIDIEAVPSMPICDDFREHPFYVDNFTDREIAYCICQPQPRESFCGLWAAKEAVLKATGAQSGVGSLRHIEIAHDGDGRPGTATAMLSISHAAGTCVAVALLRPPAYSGSGSSGAEAAEVSTPHAGAEGGVRRSGTLARSLAAAAAAVAFSGIGFTMAQMPW